ncbi:hypothetical protein V2G26_006402 [Clonostachys chloroleuca]
MTEGHPNQRTLFHLIPLNDEAEETLTCPKNKKYVSRNEGQLGLEIGFHVPDIPSDYVITRLGRSQDLILDKDHISSVHLVFELHPFSFDLLLRSRSRSVENIRIAPLHIEDAECVADSYVINYGQQYRILIEPYEFQLKWLATNVASPDKAHYYRNKTLEEYQVSVLHSKDVNARQKATAVKMPAPESWYDTRVQPVKNSEIHEVPGSRVFLGARTFGTVHRALEQSGYAIAVKEIEVRPGADPERLRRMIHREVKIMASYTHTHIIEFLGMDDCLTDRVKIYMPLRDGNAKSLAEKVGFFSRQLVDQVFHEMLQALDFLACSNVCHRDVKPENILYSTLGKGIYRFQLADFGLASHAKPGTLGYTQSPKMDIWSLAVTLIELDSSIQFPPTDYEPSLGTFSDVRKVVKAENNPFLASMAVIDPGQRASAADLLINHFNGVGLTSKVGKASPRGQNRGAEASSSAQQQPGRQLRPRVNNRAVVEKARGGGTRQQPDQSQDSDIIMEDWAP